MAVPTRLSRDEAREQTRARMLAAARDVFIRDGFHRASTDAIAKVAGYSRGALYSSWRTKEEVFFAVLDAEIVERFERLQPPQHGTVKDRLRAMARRYGRLLAEDPGWSLLMIEFTAHAARSPELARQLRQRNVALVDELAGRLEDGLGYTTSQAKRSAHAMVLLQSGLVVERMASGDALPGDLAEELVSTLAEPPWFTGTL